MGRPTPGYEALVVDQETGEPCAEGVPGEAGLTATERQVAAKDRFDGAMREAGSDLSDILWRVVCGCETLPVAEKELHWPARSGKLVLRIALERVAGFYRIT